MGDPGNRLSGTVSVVAMPTILNWKTEKYTSHGPSLRSCHTYFHVLIIYAPDNEFPVTLGPFPVFLGRTSTNQRLHIIHMHYNRTIITLKRTYTLSYLICSMLGVLLEWIRADQMCKHWVIGRRFHGIVICNFLLLIKDVNAGATGSKTLSRTWAPAVYAQNSNSSWYFKCLRIRSE